MMRSTGRAAGALIAVMVAVFALVGCSSGAPTTAPAPSLPPVRPAGVQDPAVTATGDAGGAPTRCDDGRSPRQSWLPPDPMPSPGHMPAGSTMAAIARRGLLKVGVDQNSYLFGYRDTATGQIVGFDIDIAHEVARAIFGDPTKVQFVSITSAQRIPFVADGTVDLVADSMTITCDRLAQVDFTTDYFDAGQKILVAKGSGYRTIDDLGGKKVCAAAGTTSIQTIAQEPSHPIPVAVKDWTDCLVLLQQGQIDAISTDDSILIGLARQDPDVEVVGPRFTDEPHGLAIAQKNRDFVRFVNGVLQRLRTDGTWAAIYERWLGGPAPTPPPAQYLPAGFSGADG